MDTVRALTGHHGLRATCKQIVRTFEIRWGSHDCLRCSEARTASSRTRRISARVRLVPARVPYGICKVPKTHREPIELAYACDHVNHTRVISYMYVLLKCHRPVQLPKSYGPGTTRMSPVTSAYFSFVIDHLCTRIVSVTASYATAALRVRFQL